MKKRKLNSTNPKYQKEDTTKKIKQTKKLINETKGVKIYAVFVEQDSKENA
tara:strand:+ start:1690 stop:1842 length:153 start_codon:yes stop_codon:yes gene_type:complete